VEGRKEGNKIPQLSDLRESGAIEQDADMVMFLYRPEYYEINQNEMGESRKGETHIKIAKHRNGSLETVMLKGLLHIQKFVDWDDNENDYGAGLPSNFKPIPGGGATAGGRSDAALYIEKPSKMNDFDEDYEESDLI
jgi:replicative DNA helicase